MDLSVAQFCQRAGEYMETDPAKFVRYVLNGLEDETEITLNPLLDALQDSEELDAKRDYDSLLGINSNILVKAELSMFPAPKLTDTLQTSIHINHPFLISSEEEEESIPVHKVPNICIGKWGTRGSIRAMIPRLYRPGRNSQLTQEEMALFYEKGLRPAILELTPAQSAEWPSTYQAEMWRARGRTGQLALASKVVDAWYMPHMGDEIRRSLEANGLDWGEGLVFLHEIRGVKHGSGHSVDAFAANLTLTDWLEEHGLDRGEMEASGVWYIDVGIEFASVERRCLAWRTGSHRHIVQAVMEIEEQRATTITRPGSSKYTRDMVSHMPSVSGCRIEPGVTTRGPYDVRYLQLYTTDKSITYRPEGYHRGKFISALDILKGKSDSFIDGLYDTYSNATRDNWSLARLEVRVPLQNAELVLLDDHLRLVREWIISFQREAFWGLRAYRAAALKFVVQWQGEYDGAIRKRNSSLLLTAAASWLINSLHSSPDKGASCKQLMRAVLPLGERDEVHADVMAFGTPTNDDDVGGESDNEEFGLVPIWPRGLVFLNPIRLGEGTPVPRFHGNTVTLTESAFTFFFGTNMKGMIDLDVGNSIRAPPNPDRTRNKARKTPILWPEVEARELERPFAIPDAPVNRIQRMDEDEGSDLGDDDIMEDGLSDDLNVALDLIWKQFLVDIAEKTPNRRNRQNPSYCILNSEARRVVDESTYIGDPTEFFNDFQWKRASPEEWSMVFARLFPKKEEDISARVQGYHTTRWFRSWDTLRRRMDNIGVENVRKDLKGRVDGFCWLPFAQTDKLWPTRKQTGRGWNYMEQWGHPSVSPPREKRACPAIYINPKYRQ